MDDLSYDFKPRECRAFCDCDLLNTLEFMAYKGKISNFVKCRCGEEEWHTMDWMWHEDDADALFEGRDIIFHPTYSQGTVIIRGEQQLNAGMIHYWEIRVLSPLCGTDVMFGIGTSDVDLNMYRVHFGSPLGVDNKAWGYSYTGKLHHNGVQKTYGQRITRGCVVGVYVDRSRGILEFYLNRRPMGVAFTNIPTDPNVKLYPLVSSTMAKSTIRLINATSKPVTLQLLALQKLHGQDKAMKQLERMPGMKKLLQSHWFLSPPIPFGQLSARPQLDIWDLAVLPANIKLKRRLTNDDPDDIPDVGLESLYDDICPNPTKIPVPREEEHSEFQLFDEYFYNASQRI